VRAAGALSQSPYVLKKQVELSQYVFMDFRTPIGLSIGCPSHFRAMLTWNKIRWHNASHGAHTQSTKAREPDESGQLVLADQGSSKLWRPTKRLLLPNEK
jgi:hypothetical protein